jgi:hypothetical protein
LIRIPIQIYAFLTIVCVTMWPIVLLYTKTMTPLTMAFNMLGSIVVLIIVWRYCSSPTISFWNGLVVISAKLNSGCFNISILYLPLFLTVIYLIALTFTLVGIFKGKSWSQGKWLGLIGKFV